MVTICKRWHDVQVGDLMHRDVIGVPTHVSMQSAARMMLDAGQSGAPVIDEMGICVGVISAGDFLQLERDRESICSAGTLDTVHELVCNENTGSYEMMSGSFDEIRRHMTSAVQTIAPTASMYDAARMMAGESIHQLLVLDSSGRPVGLLSSGDVIEFAIGVAEAGPGPDESSGNPEGTTSSGRDATGGDATRVSWP